MEISPRLAKTKSERKANFIDVEVRVLLDLYRQYRCQLNAKFSSVVTRAVKAVLWQKIASAVSACGLETRSGNEVRTKWKFLKRAALKASRETTSPSVEGDQVVEHPWFTDIVLDLLKKGCDVDTTPIGISGNGDEPGTVVHEDIHKMPVEAATSLQVVEIKPTEFQPFSPIALSLSPLHAVPQASLHSAQQASLDAVQWASLEAAQQASLEAAQASAQRASLVIARQASMDANTSVQAPLGSVQPSPSTNATVQQILSSARRKRQWLARHKGRADANQGLMLAETAKARLEHKKLRLECSVLEKKQEIGALKITLLKRKLQLLNDIAKV